MLVTLTVANQITLPVYSQQKWARTKCVPSSVNYIDIRTPRGFAIDISLFLTGALSSTEELSTESRHGGAWPFMPHLTALFKHGTANEPSLFMTTLTKLDQTLAVEDDWSAVKDPNERRKRQSRLRQRAWRKYQHVTRKFDRFSYIPKASLTEQADRSILMDRKLTRI